MKASAAEIRKRHPSDAGWQRIESHACGGTHRMGPGMRGSVILWRRRRQYFNEQYEELDITADPPLWAAEQVRPTLCVDYRFYYANQITANLAMGCPWSFSGPPAAGETVKLVVANGTWLWQLLGDKGSCGGWLARWPD